MIKNRIIQVLEFKGIAKENFYKKIGVTSANFRGKAKETPINSHLIENILSEIPDLNSRWLLTGKGSMLKEDNFKKKVKNYDAEGHNINQKENILEDGEMGYTSQYIKLLEKSLEEKTARIKELENEFSEEKGKKKSKTRVG